MDAVEAPSKVARDPSLLAAQVASLLGKSKVRIQRVFQHSSAPAKDFISCIAALGTRGNLLFVGKVSETKVVAAFTENSLARQGTFVDSPRSFLLSMETTHARASDIYAEKPLAGNQSYLTQESPHTLIPRGCAYDVYSTSSLPNTTAYRITFDPRTQIGTNSNSILNFCNPAWNSLLVVYPGYVTDKTIQSTALNYIHRFHPSGDVWGYKFTAYSNADTRGRVCGSRPSITFGQTLPTSVFASTSTTCGSRSRPPSTTRPPDTRRAPGEAASASSTRRVIPP